MNFDDIDAAFPKEQYREGQKACIEFAVNAYNSGKKVVIWECPTGSGKSAMAMTLANLVNQSYYVTITKQLQDQLLSDFPDAVDLKGKNAYPCTYIERNAADMLQHMPAAILAEKKIKHHNCNVGYCRSFNDACTRCWPAAGEQSVNGQLSSLPLGMKYSACPYFEQVELARKARKVVMNFSSFLHQKNLTKRFDVRDLLIIDEGHGTESQLLSYVSLTLEDSKLSRYGIFVPELESALDYVKWIDDADVIGRISEAISAASAKEDFTTVDDLSRTLVKCRSFKTNIESNPEWVCEYVGEEDKRSVTMRPVFVRDFVGPLLLSHANLVLIMSATILDVNTFCKSLGLDKKHVASYRMKNRFPVKNRPIYLKPVAKMTGGKSNMVNWEDKLIDGVNEILEKHPDRGIIHTHNFAIMNAILRGVKKKYKHRLISQNDFPNKHEMLIEHAKNQGSVIVAPAMHEGVDLNGDLSRFQIICKVPYANMFDDKQLARRVELDRNYYTWLTALKLVQSYGRSIRSDDDYADTYILDESIYKFLDDAKKILPIWFTEAIK